MKQRLIGAAVLVALAVIFLPMLVQGPAPDSGVADLSMQMPAEPEGGFETRDLPLVTPGAVTSEGLLGDGRGTLPTVDTATAPAAGDAPAPDPDAAELADRSQPMLPASVAGGDFVVGFGAYATRANADTVVARLRGEDLPAFAEAATVAGKSAWRVRVGPYASRADAEIARIAAGQVGPGVQASVVALDATASPAAAARPPSTASALPSAPGGATATALPPDTAGPARAPLPATVAERPATSAAAAAAPLPPATPVAAAAPATGTGFAVQLGAFAKGAEAIAMRDRLRAAGIDSFTDTVQTDGGSLTRVKAGPVLSRADADRLKAQVRGRFGIDGLVRAHP